MVSKDALRTVIADQLRELGSLRYSVPRTVYEVAASYTGASTFVVKGIRRCGKSTLLQQLMKARFDEDFFYFNFDDERVAGFGADDFQVLMETLIESFGERKNVFFDEIQNVPGWELFINRIMRQGYRVFITGSNANLLSRELGTSLTGRHVDIELYPFSFTEYLRAKGVPVPARGLYTTEEKAVLSKSFKDYLLGGGMPEAVVNSNEAVLTTVVSDIVQRDITGRYSVRKPVELRSVLRFLMANIGSEITIRSITNNFGIKSSNTVQKYVEYAEEAYLFFTLRRFERKLKRFDKNPRKIYCVDNGIVVRNTPSIIERKGALLENVIAVQLRRLSRECYYFRGTTGAEADFVVSSGGQVIQVCYDLSRENEEREAKGLVEAMGETGLNVGLILTLEQERVMSYKGKEITAKPAWQWLLENETAHL